MNIKPIRIRKLSSLLELALKDLRKQERAKNSKVDMSCWLRKSSNGTCYACLAGSVMRHTLKVVPRVSVDGVGDGPSHLPARQAGMMCALNCLRAGCTGEAFLAMNPGTDMNDPRYEKARRLSRVNISYNLYPETWWEEMKALLADLKEAGL